MKCTTCGCKMTQLFVSWVCDNCKPVESSNKQPTEPAVNPPAFVYTPPPPYCFGDFRGAHYCLRCPVKAKCLDKTVG